MVAINQKFLDKIEEFWKKYNSPEHHFNLTLLQSLANQSSDYGFTRKFVERFIPNKKDIVMLNAESYLSSVSDVFKDIITLAKHLLPETTDNYASDAGILWDFGKGMVSLEELAKNLEHDIYLEDKETIQKSCSLMLKSLRWFLNYALNEYYYSPKSYKILNLVSYFNIRKYSRN